MRVFNVHAPALKVVRLETKKVKIIGQLFDACFSQLYPVMVKPDLIQAIEALSSDVTSQTLNNWATANNIFYDFQVSIFTGPRLYLSLYPPQERTKTESPVAIKINFLSQNRILTEILWQNASQQIAQTIYHPLSKAFHKNDNLVVYLWADETNLIHYSGLGGYAK